MILRRLFKLPRLALYYCVGQWLPASNHWWGRWARPIRRVICTPLFRHAGKNINIEAHAFFGSGADIDIGDNSSIGVRAEMHGPVTIGNNVMMGPGVLILTENHMTSRTDIPMLEQGFTLPQRVSVGDDVWIGQRATLLPGVEIGCGSIIGACAVVSRSVPPYSIVVGNPARIVKSRIPHNE